MTDEITDEMVMSALEIWHENHLRIPYVWMRAALEAALKECDRDNHEDEVVA
jgi:hypothetical protein